METIKTGGLTAEEQAQLKQEIDRGAPARYGWPMPTQSPMRPDATGNPVPFGSQPMKGIETVSGHGLYSFPRDHRYHYGPVYHGPEYAEWLYFSAFGTDKKTGDPYTLFWMSLLVGYDKQMQRPLKNTFIALHNLRTGEFLPGVTLYPGELVTNGSDDHAAKEDFWYSMKIGTEEHGFLEEIYHAKDETWQFNVDIKKKPPMQRVNTGSMRITGKVYAPGYVYPTPMGLENEGHDTSRSGRHNPATVYGISYYYLAPKMFINGPVTIGNRSIEFDGVAWFEHQWGNMRTPDHEEGIYIWQDAYLNNGDMFRLRMWRKPDLSHDDTINNYAYIHKDGRMEFAYGPAVKFTPIKSYQSKVVEGIDIPLYGILETPQGKYYVAPEFPDQQAIGFAPQTSLWEGCLYLHEGSLDGPIVGRCYLENMITPWFYVPGGFDLPFREEIRRALDGGCPPAPDFKFYK
ncbi:Hydroxyneurosporene synthase (CrtC) [Cnuella takakiae]|uniref:Hydroxyneurosporene synthase (CrtC) n=1 Tax=Cnuella takakiae TaxID=1302690 RepID=A0A1M5B8A1_9BACT|nr:lipocalin-like domain-containing protein [Cnuella takakiae]OLY93373.1 hypothetical protein BUE76_16915 [Cnuella takakiae]SHF38678.1 Hydroxyneurosporene synthase (CrtC) [Cnuella takakiae]